MKQQNKQRYLIRYLTIFAILISIVIVKTSCTKLDVGYQPNQVHPPNFVEQFFTTKTTPTPAVANLIQKLKDENERTGFVNNLPKNCGLPIWEKVVIKKQHNHNEDNSLYSPASHGPSASFLTEDSTEVDVIPLTITDSALSSVIIVKDENGTISTDCITTNGDLYNLVNGSNTTAATEQLNLFFYMENETFGTTQFYHIPTNLFPQITHTGSDGMKIITVSSDSSANDDPSSFRFCKKYIIYCTECWQFPCSQGNSIEVEVCTTIIVPPGGGGTGTGGTGTGGTGGGGTGTGTGGSGGNTGCNDPFYSFGPCGPNNPPPPPPPPPHNPCDSLNKYATTNSMQLLVAELKNQIPTRRENLYIFNDLTNSNSPLTYVQGQENQFGVYPADEAPFVGCYGWIHNHFADADSAGLIFSAGDLNIFAEQIVRDSTFFQVNSKRFMIGVVADSGSNYILMIENLAQFRQWATTLFSNENMIEVAFNGQQMSTQFLPISKAESEKRFLKVIGGTGLKLFRGNSTGSSWMPIKLNSSGTVVENPCL